MRETELYPPIKAWLEARGFEVKAEIGQCDVVACRDGEDPVIVELKTGFSLTLFHQGIDRLKLSDTVYIAVPRGKGRAWYKSWKDNPAPYAPRKQIKRKGALLKAFSRLEGDPNTGGMRGARVTAYRQDAVKIATFLKDMGPSKGAVVAKETGVEPATRMMRDNHYGWFEKVETGIYQLRNGVEIP